jgi:hypothetical protein
MEKRPEIGNTTDSDWHVVAVSRFVYEEKIVPSCIKFIFVSRRTIIIRTPGILEKY